MYRYAYQGQYAEKDEETGWNHFELREYNPVIGRWTAVDPMRQYWSPYVGMGNDPVSGVDPTGGCTDSNGNVIPCPEGADAGIDGFHTTVLDDMVVTDNGYHNFDGVITGFQNPGHFPTNDFADRNSFSPAPGNWDTYSIPLSLMGGDFMVDAYYTGEDLYNGNYGSAAINAGLFFVPYASSSYARVPYRLANATKKILKFGGDEAVIHFKKHAGQIMKLTGKSSYNLKNYVDDANWIIQNGTYSSKLNGYYRYMGNATKSGESLFGFVGMKNGGSSISTFHVKTRTQLGL